MIKRICFATRNKHKVEEVKSKLQTGIELISLDDISCTEELPETTNTIEGNSAQKAQYVWDNFKVNCFADDSGLEVDALNGEPGVDSAFYSGTRDFDSNIDFLLKNLSTCDTREAQFKTVVTLIIDGVLHQFTGIVRGEILKEKQGEKGFGYDPVFVPNGYDKTFAEMTLQEKNKISHRSIAIQKLLDYLNK